MMTGTKSIKGSFFTAFRSFLARIFNKSEPDRDYSDHSSQTFYGSKKFTNRNSQDLIDNYENRIRALKEEVEGLSLERKRLDDISNNPRAFSLNLPQEKEKVGINSFEGYLIKEVPLMMELKDDLLRRHELRLKKVETQSADLIRGIRDLIFSGRLTEAKLFIDDLNQIIVEVESKDIRDVFKDTILLWNKERRRAESEAIHAEALKKRSMLEESSMSNSTSENSNIKGTEGDEDSRQEKYNAMMERIRSDQLSIEHIRSELSRILFSCSRHWRGINSQLNRCGIVYLYHYTDKRNLASINKYGGLLSYGFMEAFHIDVPAAIGDIYSHNIDKDLHTIDYIKLLPGIDSEAISKLKEDRSIVLLKINTEVACFQDSRFCPQSLFDKDFQVSDDYRLISKYGNQLMILAKTFIPKSMIVEILSC